MKDVSRMTADEARIELESKRIYITKINNVIKELTAAESAGATDEADKLWTELNILLEAAMSDIH